MMKLKLNTKPNNTLGAAKRDVVKESAAKKKITGEIADNKIAYGFDASIGAPATIEIPKPLIWGGVTVGILIIGSIIYKIIKRKGKKS